MIDIMTILYITMIVALILSVISLSYVIYYRVKLKDIELISDVIKFQNNKIADIAWKVDLLSKKSSPDEDTKHPNKIELDESEPISVTKEETKERVANDLESIIINSLKNQELSSSEIQALVGRTREHVSRTLKKMVETGTLERNESHKPYKYRLISSSNKE